MYLRQMEIVQDVDKLKVDLQKVFMTYRTIKKWAYIIHDKDDTRPHYHIYLNFGTSVDSLRVAKWFELGYSTPDGKYHTGEQFINRVEGRTVDMLTYLIHGNESQRDKYQYSPSEVVANFDWQKVIALSDIIGDFERYSYAQQLAVIEQMPLSEKPSNYRKLKNLWEIHCQAETLKTDRHIDVVFVDGEAGAGKTYYSKKLLEKMGLDYCVSSSSNDPFQDYLGQRAIILDDLRDKAFDLVDLLKILDNNTSSSAKSRFNNKVFNGDVIVITSSVSISKWYVDNEDCLKEDLQQLYRRISCYVKVTKETVFVYEQGLNKLGMPNGVALCYENTLIQNQPKKENKFSFGNYFAELCPYSKTPFDNGIKKQATLFDDGELPY